MEQNDGTVNIHKTIRTLDSFNDLNDDLLVLLLLLCPSAAFSLRSNICFTPPRHVLLIDGFFAAVPEPTISVNDLQDRSDDDLRKLWQENKGKK